MKISRKTERILWVSLLIVLFFINVKIPNFHEKAFAESLSENSYYDEMFMNVLHKIQNEFVDPSKTSYKDLINGAIKGMIATLDDPHTAYLEPKSFEGMISDAKGSYEGIGAHIRELNGRLIILAPIEGSPSWKAGLKPGDAILEIAGSNATGYSIDDAATKLRGPKGSRIELLIERAGEERPLAYKIMRDSINLKSVEHEIISEHNVAYVKIRQFSERTPAELEEALSDIKTAKVDSLVIDLRNNPGGLLESAYHVADMFLEKGVIVYSKDRRGEVVYQKEASPVVSFPTFLPMIVLVNGYSASASEIVAGALQDSKRAVLLGEKTFGKFSVQNLFPIDPKQKNAFKMTTAYYYLPSGRSLHKEGIVPEIEVKLPTLSAIESKMLTKLRDLKLVEEYLAKYPRASEDEKNIGELFSEVSKREILLSEDLIRFALDKKRTENKMPALYDLKYDLQLNRAIEALKVQNIFKK